MPTTESAPIQSHIRAGTDDLERVDLALSTRSVRTLRHTPRGLGLATATTSAAFFPHLEQRSRGARVSSDVDQPTRRARASGSISRTAPHSQTTRTGNCPKQSSSLLM
jgi:hypothetical protein